MRNFYNGKFGALLGIVVLITTCLSIFSWLAFASYTRSVRNAHTLSHNNMVPSHRTLEGVDVFGSMNMVGKNSVTLVTQTSLEEYRVDRVKELLERWPGNVVVVAVIPKDNRGYRSRFEILKSHIRESERTDTAVLVPVEVDLADGVLYPINKLRNLAIKQVKTRYYMLIDVDFLPSSTLYHNLHTSLKNELENTAENTALVVPAFDLREKQLAHKIQTKRDLVKFYRQRKVLQFHHNFPAAHGPTNYTRWFNATDPYPVEYADHYEPYFVCQTQTCPLYREEFSGFGYNKLSHVYEMWTQSFRFRVVPHDFIFHIPHAYSPSARSNTLLQRNMQLFVNLQQELMAQHGRVWLLFADEPLLDEWNVAAVDWSIESVGDRYRVVAQRQQQTKASESKKKKRSSHKKKLFQTTGPNK